MRRVGSWLTLSVSVLSLSASSCAADVSQAAHLLRDRLSGGESSTEQAAKVEGPRRGPLDVVDATAVSPFEVAPKTIAVHNRAVDPDRAGILAEGAAGSGEIALTFDDGPAAGTTTEVLRILAAHRVRATFFLTGRRLAGSGVVAEVNRGLARAIVTEGHLVGNHGLDHLPLDRIAPGKHPGPDWVGYQIEESARRIAEATGISPHYFRPPYGKLGPEATAILGARHDELVMWTIDAQDAQEADPQRLARRLIAQIIFAGQGVVLLHDLRPSSVRALSILLDWLDAHPRDSEKATGFSVVDLPTYLENAAAHPYPFSTRGQLLHARERMHGR